MSLMFNLSYARHWESLSETADPWRAGSDRAYAVLVREGGSSEKPNPKGAAFIVVNVTISRMNQTFFRLSLPRPILQYNLDIDEQLIIYAPRSFFPLCAPVEAAIPLMKVDVTSAPNPAAAATRTATTVVTATAVGVGAVGASSAVDAQTIAVIALMSCAQPVERKVMKNNRLLAPLALDDSFEGMVLGNIALIAVFLVIHTTCLMIFWKACKKKKRTRLSAFAMTWFPSLTLGCASLTYQGTAIASMKILTEDDSPPTATGLVVGVLGLIVCILTPLTLLIVTHRHVHASFTRYKYEDTKWRFPWLRYFLPVGKWETRDMRKAYGVLFAGMRHKHLFWTTMSLWSPTIMVLGATFKPGDADACRLQFSVLAAIQFIIAAFILITRPYRTHFNTLLAVTSNCCLGGILSASAHLSVVTDSDNAKMITVRAVQAQTAVTAMRLGYRVIIFIAERTKLKNVEREELYCRVGTVPEKNESAPSDIGSSDDDEASELDSILNGPPLLQPTDRRQDFSAAILGEDDLLQMLEENERDQEKEIVTYEANVPGQLGAHTFEINFDNLPGTEGEEDAEEYTVEDELRAHGSILGSLGRDEEDTNAARFLSQKHRRRKMMTGGDQPHSAASSPPVPREEDVADGWTMLHSSPPPTAPKQASRAATDGAHADDELLELEALLGADGMADPTINQDDLSIL